MTSYLTTPPAIRAGTLAAGPQPVLSADGGLLLRPWETTDAAIFLAAFRDPAIRHWHTRGPGSEDQVREWFGRFSRDWAQEKGGDQRRRYGPGAHRHPRTGSR